MSYVRLRHVTKRFGGVTAVNDLTVDIEKGECFSMIGPSGCGKTTTLRMVAGFEDLDEGEIVVGDRLFSSSAKRFYLPSEKRDFGMVFQAFAVWPHLNVFENIAFPLKARHLPKAEIAERTRRAATYTGLEKLEKAYPDQLSGGQKQRIALARAIAINPTVMLLDEPLSNLDPKLREEMRFEIKDLQRRFGFTIIYVTHDQAEAMALSDRIMVMSPGKVEQVDTPLNIYNRPANRFVFSFTGASNMLPACVSDGGIYIEGALSAGRVAEEIPPSVTSRRFTLACRPREIDLSAQGPVTGVVKRKTYLGDMIDYRVGVGPVDVRVETGRRKGFFNEGDTCVLTFRRIFCYEGGE
jgi:iron(III) transport system ATP-binding protein